MLTECSVCDPAVNFDIIGGISHTETIARGTGIRELSRLRRTNSAAAAPPTALLTVADATVAEPGAGAEATLDFVVTLDPASSGTVTAVYTTADGANDGPLQRAWLARFGRQAAADGADRSYLDCVRLRMKSHDV